MTRMRLIGLTALSGTALCASAAAATGPGTIRISVPKTTRAGKHNFVISVTGRANGFSLVYVFVNPGRTGCRPTVRAEKRLRLVNKRLHPQTFPKGRYRLGVTVRTSTRGSHLVCAYLTRARQTARASARYVTR